MLIHFIAGLEISSQILFMIES